MLKKLVCFYFVLLALPALLIAQDQVSDQISEELTGSQMSPESLAEYYESGDVSLPEIPGNVIKIKLSEAVRIALDHNLELQAATFGAKAAEATLRGAYGLYDLTLLAEYTKGDAQTLLNTLPVTSTQVDYQFFSVSLLQKLPLGTELTLSGMRHYDEYVPALPVSPAYESRAQVSLSQPLLKGFGQTVTEEQIIYADKNQQIAFETLRDKAFKVVAAVRHAYLDTLQRQYELSYRETSVNLAKRIVKENIARVNAGILAPVEKLEAEVGLQTRERLLLDAQRAFADALDAFNLLLDAQETVYLPVIQPFTMEFTTFEAAGVESGLLKRPDVIRQLKGIEKIRIERTIARNSLLPELNLVASYSQAGLSDEASDSVDIVNDGDYDSWEVGVKLSYPLGSIASRNEVKRAEIKLKQERSLLAQLHREVRNEVRSAIRNIDVNRKKTEVAKRGHDLSREKLHILLKSREVGLSTTRDVLDGEEDLASARTEQITAVSDYFKSITDYLRVTGTLLENENIIFRDNYSPDGTQPIFQLAR